MSESHFSADEWRPGKNRKSYPRKRAWGGQKKIPDALAAVAKASGFASGKAKKCKYCGRPALKDSADGLCRHHNGGKQAAMVRPYVFKHNPQIDKK